jgi:alpha-L-fucosidase
MLSRRSFLAAAPFSALAAPAPPAPYGALPSPRHLLWHQLETYAFLHFTVNTFTDREWGYGDENPQIFNPAQFDADRMVDALAAGGMKAVILTCKHHDGFCLWPTRTTEHSIRQSPWKDGKGDIVREIAEAAKRRGLKFGVYLSPWDRNHPQYARPEYVQVYREQLRELLTGYGPIYEVWHDGANGGDGYYGGAREKRTIDKRSYYDWPNTWAMVRKLQPDAVVFSDVGPDIRWVGNEKGFANETCWSTYDPVAKDGGPGVPGDTRSKEGLSGHRNASRWLPAECDVSIRPGWFWHEKENGRVKSPRDLLDLYYKSVGRNASFLLNVPPDRRGLLHENDVASLQGYGDLIRRTFERNLAGGAKTVASDTRGKAKIFAAANLLDGSRDTYWATNEGVHTAGVTFELKRPARFNVVRLREQIALGQRVEQFSVEAQQNGGWKKVAGGTSIGACRILRLESDVTAAKVRLKVEQSPAPLAISEFGLYGEAS